MADYTKADVGPAMLALLDYCVAITKDPRAGSRSGVDRLRKAGWDDQAIHDAVQVTGFFNYYDRLADGLGVDPEPSWAAAPSEAVQHPHDDQQAEADDRG
ncbi:MAG: peroxidase [Candidatus Dormibacteraeota bacterium]|nr:peroxidase [Candidatus Dormibacteraeota bacterium]